MPLSLILRDRLKYALTRKESLMIVMKKSIKVDGKVRCAAASARPLARCAASPRAACRAPHPPPPPCAAPPALPSPHQVRTELNFPAGFMDVIGIEGTGETFRLLYDTKGRFILHKIGASEAGFKLARVTAVATTAKTIPYAVTHDGRTLRYPDPLIKTHDTVKVDLATGKATEFLKFEVGNTVMITKGRNTGRIGTLVSREKHEGSFDIVQVKDASGATFATRLANAFVIGKGADAKEALISLPKGKGIKTTIFEDRDKKLGKAQ